MGANAIVAIVERGKADKIVKKAKEAGAEGATIFYARGTGSEEAKTFLNLHIDSQKEVIIILVSNNEEEKVYEAMIREGNIRCPGKGIIFMLPISRLDGLHNM